MTCWRICSARSRHSFQWAISRRAAGRLTNWASWALATAARMNLSASASSTRVMYGLSLVEIPI